MGKNETCYMCSAPATGREHVPPRCLFPESNDIPGCNYRKNLITVPSCEMHNCAKSKNDEYLIAVLTVYFQNNKIAKKHIDTKVKRTLKRSPKIAAGMVEGGGILGNDLACMSVDSARIFNVCEHVAKGLYYHHYGQKWMPAIRFLSPAFLPNNENAPAFCEKSRKFEQCAGLLLDQGGCLFLGQHQDIFKYRLIRAQDCSLVVQLVFYDGVCVSGISR